MAGGALERAAIAELAPAPLAPSPTGTPIGAATEATVADVDVSAVPDADWSIAQRRYTIVAPLLDPIGRTRSAVTTAARTANVHPATVYRWIAHYERTATLAALLPTRVARRTVAKTRLSEAVELILRETIETYYLRPERPSVQKTCVEVTRRCRNAGLPTPHHATVYRRIERIAEERRMAKRHGHHRARMKFAPLGGHFPGAEYPLAVVQLDHTKLDLILVDDVQRRPVGRPWITLAMDVYSRMVTGFAVSFDPPGALAVGLCLAHAVLPKDAWLAARHITGSWPCWGFPATIHVDNAKEFRGQMLQRACEQYGMTVQWRPVATPHYGGHIERLLGTVLEEIHGLRGTTFSNPSVREDYDAEGRAVFTLSEFEAWLTEFLVNVYHQRLHRALDTSPLYRYEAGLLRPDATGHGTGTLPRGLPSRPTDPERLRLDFLPYVDRTVQPYGVVVDGIHYYGDVLQRFIHAKDPHDATRKRTLRFRRDPRDISGLYFFDPDLKVYSRVPYRDSSHPPMSLWEFREAVREAKLRGRAAIHEADIFAAYNRLRDREAQAAETTMAARRRRQRQTAHAAVRSRSIPVDAVPSTIVPTTTRPSITLAPTTSPTTSPAAKDRPTITPFDELEELVPSPWWTGRRRMP
jgi:putative transposase